jgi:hypothetical protein
VADFVAEQNSDATTQRRRHHRLYRRVAREEDLRPTRLPPIGAFRSAVAVRPHGLSFAAFR